MVVVRWTEEAEHWLRDIHDYIALDNPLAAKEVVSGIFEKAQILARFQEIGHKYRDEKEGEVGILLYGLIGLPVFIEKSNLLIFWCLLWGARC